jgi:hypothetical protein
MYIKVIERNRNMKTKSEILGVNTEFEELNIQNFQEESFQSSVSFLDFDAVIIGANYISSSYSESSTSPYQNKRLLSQYASCQIKEDFARIKEQLVELLKQGKNIFILMGRNESCYVYTGEKKYSGTGKNARQTNIVEEFDTYSFLPLELSVTHVYGNKFELCAKQPYLDFFKVAKECYQYAAYFNATAQNTLAKIPNSDRVVSTVFEYEQGRIILLPMPYYEDDYRTKEYWKKYGKTYLNELFKLNDKLSSSINDYILPEWTSKFFILNENEELEKLNEERDKLAKIQKGIDKRENVINTIQRYKTLVSSSGNQLEKIVKIVLSEMGFTMLDAEQGRSDIIAQYGTIDVVAEVKGVTKSAAEKHAAQLEKWVAQFIEENEHSPKPILIVNGYCDTPLFERTEDVFPSQMLKYAEARNHCLLTTTQLLCLYIEIKQVPACADERIQELLATVGKYPCYINPQDLLPQNDLT